MRKIARSIARAKMEKEGVKRINRKAKDRAGIGIRGTSFFSENWKKYSGWGKENKNVVEE
jgi:hypothetical protein